MNPGIALAIFLARFPQNKSKNGQKARREKAGEASEIKIIRREKKIKRVVKSDFSAKPRICRSFYIEKRGAKSDEKKNCRGEEKKKNGYELRPYVPGTILRGNDVMALVKKALRAQ